MTQIINTKRYNLEDRTFEYSQKIRLFIKKLPKTISNYEDIKQLVRSSGSIGANYVEANESLSKKDFIMRVRISKKEAKESRYWLRLVDTHFDKSLERDRSSLIQETEELMRIFGSIIEKSK